MTYTGFTQPRRCCLPLDAAIRYYLPDTGQEQDGDVGDDSGEFRGFGVSKGGGAARRPISCQGGGREFESRLPLSRNPAETAGFRCSEPSCVHFVRGRPSWKVAAVTGTYRCIPVGRLGKSWGNLSAHIDDVADAGQPGHACGVTQIRCRRGHHVVRSAFQLRKVCRSLVPQVVEQCVARACKRRL